MLLCNTDGSFLNWGCLIIIRYTDRLNLHTQNAIMFQRIYKVTDLILKANFNHHDFAPMLSDGFFLP